MAKAKLGVSGPVVAKHLSITAMHVGRLRDQGVFKTYPDGSYDLDACRLAYIKWLREENSRNTQSSTASRAQAARARQIELRTDREQGQLMLTSEALDYVGESLGRLRSEMAGIPARVTREPGLRQKIEDEIVSVFSRVSARAEQEGRLLRARGAGTAPEPEDDA